MDMEDSGMSRPFFACFALDPALSKPGKAGIEH